jgi:hypothetical protein
METTPGRDAYPRVIGGRSATCASRSRTRRERWLRIRTQLDRSLRDVVRRMNGFSAIHSPYSMSPDFKHRPAGTDQAAWTSGRRSGSCSIAAASVSTTPAS